MRLPWSRILLRWYKPGLTTSCGYKTSLHIPLQQNTFPPFAELTCKLVISEAFCGPHQVIYVVEPVHWPSISSLPAASPNWQFAASGWSPHALDLLSANTDARYRRRLARRRPVKYRPKWSLRTHHPSSCRSRGSHLAPTRTRHGHIVRHAWRKIRIKNLPWT